MAGTQGARDATGVGSPCGACKFLRRKCAPGCVFAPYFSSEQGPARFAAIHKVFGASNVSKLLLHVPVTERCEAVVTIAYEAQARIKDPVYGCVSHIFSLQQQVTYLQAQLMQARAQLAQNMIQPTSHDVENQWQASISSGGVANSSFPKCNYEPNNYTNHISPQSSLDSVNYTDDGIIVGTLQFINSRDHQEIAFQSCSKKIPNENGINGGLDSGDLQALALGMMRRW